MMTKRFSAWIGALTNKKKKTLPRRIVMFVLSLLCFGVIPVYAVITLSISETFDDTSWFESGDLMLNVVDGRVQSPIAVRVFDTGTGPQSRDESVGDGRHGSFDPTTWANFDNDNDISDNFIRIDTTVYSDLQFTHFEIANGMTLRPVGDNPLVIRSLGDVIVDGIIDCSGENGEDLNGDDSTVTQGGVGICGGGDGGNGGSVSVAPEDGESLSASINAGGAGPNADPTDGNGGGGGGSFTITGGGRDPLPGEDSAGGAGGGAGSLATDDDFNELVGGAGGGGGSVYDNGTGGDSAGGAGGAGGGIIYIVALGDVIVNATGQIIADGGAGGTDLGVLEAGGGGGGGGGGIVVFTFGNLHIDATGTISAMEGAAGAPAFSANSDGGKGARGRTWVTDNDLTFTGGGAETPTTNLTFPGIIRYASGSRTADSVAINTNSSMPTILSSVETATLGTSSSVNVLVSMGDTSDFTPTLWQDVNSVTQASKPYLRFRVAIDQQDSQNPSYLEDLTITYSPFIEDEFDFTGACGLVDGGKIGPPPSAIWSLILLLLFTLMLPLGLKLKLWLSDQ